MLNDAKSLAFKDVENHFTRRQNDYYVYFDMREQQLEIIERVLPKITALPVIVQEAEIVADFVQDLGEHVHSGNTAGRYREKLELAKRFCETTFTYKPSRVYCASSALSIHRRNGSVFRNKAII